MADGVGLAVFRRARFSAGRHFRGEKGTVAGSSDHGLVYGDGRDAGVLAGYDASDASGCPVSCFSDRLQSSRGYGGAGGDACGSSEPCISPGAGAGAYGRVEYSHAYKEQDD